MAAPPLPWPLTDDRIWIVSPKAEIDTDSRIFGTPWPLHRCEPGFEIARVFERTNFHRLELERGLTGLCQFCGYTLPGARV